MIRTLHTPAEYEKLPSHDISGAVCVVFDILRATTTIITALAGGAAVIVPVADIAQALEESRKRPRALLAGERGGLRITAAQTGGVDFHLGNSPREFTAERVRDREIITTTTNGTRALRACLGARAVYPAAFINLSETARRVAETAPGEVLLVCAGTGEESAWEDTLAAGAMAVALGRLMPELPWSDATRVAVEVWLQNQANCRSALGLGTNGKRLLENPELAPDVAVCAELDTVPLAATQSPSGEISLLKLSGI